MIDGRNLKRVIIQKYRNQKRARLKVHTSGKKITFNPQLPTVDYL
jgi:hypothetical protein